MYDYNHLKKYQLLLKFLIKDQVYITHKRCATFNSPDVVKKVYFDIEVIST